ncbi:MAG: metallophosphoesterase family protein [Gemmatimonadetes bacterium]|nr:metallophosphoesterase family protein [Gemmatimonadota bacterium]
MRRMASAPGKIAVFGGVYSNDAALRALIGDARERRCEALFCLGDLGGFGPSPDRIFPLLREAGVHAIQGNYDHSVGHGLPDCACGYTDPADNHYARLAYGYTLARTSRANRAWMARLPAFLRLRLGDAEVLLCHGSPRRTNEFLWDSTSSTAFLRRLASEAGADLVLVTHTGIPWTRALGAGVVFANVGAIGRPANDGSPRVWYAVVEASAGGAPRVELVSLAYDHERLARDMERERLPAEFVETIRTGWWTTCLEILPGRERARGIH